jgi:hypothetical protein
MKGASARTKSGYQKVDDLRRIWGLLLAFFMPRQIQAPVRWSILILHAKATWLGDIEASTEAEAIAKGAEKFAQPKERLMAVRRG